MLVAPYESWLHYAAPAVGALIVLAAGKWQSSRKAVHEAVEDVEEDIAEEKAEEAARQAASKQAAGKRPGEAST